MFYIFFFLRNISRNTCLKYLIFKINYLLLFFIIIIYFYFQKTPRKSIVFETAAIVVAAGLRHFSSSASCQGKLWHKRGLQVGGGDLDSVATKGKGGTAKGVTPWRAIQVAGIHPISKMLAQVALQIAKELKSERAVRGPGAAAGCLKGGPTS